jgi:hypothetical protein
MVPNSWLARWSKVTVLALDIADIVMDSYGVLLQITRLAGHKGALVTFVFSDVQVDGFHMLSQIAFFIGSKVTMVTFLVLYLHVPSPDMIN